MPTLNEIRSQIPLYQVPLFEGDLELAIMVRAFTLAVMNPSTEENTLSFD
jgi:hypothetical protein